MRVFRIRLIALLVIFLTSSFYVHTAFTQEGDQPEPQTPDKTGMAYMPIIRRESRILNLFGAETWSLSTGGGLDKMKQAKATWVRRNALLWSDVETTRGARNWGNVSSLEKELVYAAQNDFEQILVIRSTPTWAQKYPGYYCGPIRNDSTVQGFNDFAKFIGDVVTRYTVPPFNVNYFEIWNEPDIERQATVPDSIFGCWGERGDTYYGGRYYGDLLKVVYPYVKQANPDAQLLVGGLVVDCNPALSACTNKVPPKFLEGILKTGAGGSFDGVSYHSYDYYQLVEGRYYNPNWGSSWNTTGPAMIAKATYLRNLLNSYGYPNKYLINSENALICGSTGSEPECQTAAFQDTKAEYITQAYVFAHAIQLRSSIWYSIFGWRGSALLTQNQTPYPVYQAYSFVANKLTATVSAKQLSLGSGTKAYELAKNGSRIWVLWSMDGNSHQVILPQTPVNAWRWDDATDQYKSVNAGTTQSVTIAPLIVEFIP